MTPDANGWLPIETAPKDTAILTYGFGYEVAHFNKLLGAWVANWDHRKIQEPDCWQPLPAMPAKESDAA